MLNPKKFFPNDRFSTLTEDCKCPGELVRNTDTSIPLPKFDSRVGSRHLYF